jgi:3-oxoacyl-[acyl-carrier protein] reductase
MEEVAMDLELRDRVALVAASSRGMGKATALRFAREGAAVVICARGQKALQEAAREIQQATQAGVLAVQADLTDAKEIERLVDATLERFGRIDALVCNAGGPPALRFGDAGESEWAQALDLSLHSTLRLVRQTLPAMCEQKSGSIVAITSTTVKEPSADLILSTVPRLGVVGLFKALSREYGPQGIRFNVVCPGGFRTDRSVELLARRARETGHSVDELLLEVGRRVPLQRLGEPQEIADAIVFLCSARASYVTGTVLAVDGGRTHGV